MNNSSDSTFQAGRMMHSESVETRVESNGCARGVRRCAVLPGLLGWFVGCLLLVWGPNVSRTEAEDASQRLSAVVMRLSDWVGTSPDAEAWRLYLDLNEIETLAGRGYRADAAALERAAERFTAGGSGLQHPTFQSVRESLLVLAQRIRAAESAYPSDVYGERELAVWSEAFQKVAGDLRVSTGGELNRWRRQALAEVQALRQYVEERGFAESAYVPLPPVLRALKSQQSEWSAEEFFQTQREQLASLERWLSATVVVPWESEAAVSAAYGSISDGVRFQIDDQSEGLLDRVDAAGPVQQVAWQRDEVPAEADPVEILTALRPLQTWLRDSLGVDANPYGGCASLALDHYVLALNLGRRENLPQLLGRQIDNLVAALSEWRPDGDRNKQADAARIIGLLESVGQAETLTDAFKRTFWRNNAAVFVGERLVNRLGSRPVQQSQPVYEVILDNEVYGTAHTNGQVRIDFVPNASQAHVSLQLSGQVHSDNYTPAGPITAYSGSDSAVEARRSIYLNTGGWYQRSPYAAVQLGSYFKGTSCGRLIDQLAEMQFQTQQAGAEAIGARRAEQRLLREFGQETATALAKGREELAARRQQSGWLRSVRPTAYLLTDESFLQFNARKFGGSQTLALAQSPELTVPADFAVQIHESFLNNFLEDQIGGLVLSDADLERMERELQPVGDGTEGTIQPRGDDAQRDPFELTLASTRPVEIRFADQIIQVVLNIRNFKSQGQSINDVQVTINMVFHREPEGSPGIRLRQIGEIKAGLLDPDKIDLNTATVLDLIETTLNEEIARQREKGAEGAQGVLLLDNLVAPEWLEQVEDAQAVALLRDLLLVKADFSQGWLSMAWQADAAAVPVDVQIPAIMSHGEFEDRSRSLQAPQE
jgi:hypothetical protein